MLVNLVVAEIDRIDYLFRLLVNVKGKTLNTSGPFQDVEDIVEILYMPKLGERPWQLKDVHGTFHLMNQPMSSSYEVQRHRSE